MEDIGARNVFYNDLHITEQVEDVLKVTGGHVYRIFDAAATGDAFANEWFVIHPSTDKNINDELPF